MTPREKTKERIREICTAHNIEPHRVIERYRSEPYLKARREIAVFLRDEKDWSLPRIGAILNRNHATVIHMLKGYRRGA